MNEPRIICINFETGIKLDESPTKPPVESASVTVYAVTFMRESHEREGLFTS